MNKLQGNKKQNSRDTNNFPQFTGVSNNENLNLNNIANLQIHDEGKMQLLKPMSTRNLHNQLRVVGNGQNDTNDQLPYEVNSSHGRPSLQPAGTNEASYAHQQQHKVQQLESEIQSEPFEVIKSPLKERSNRHEAAITADIVSRSLEMAVSGDQ